MTQEEFIEKSEEEVRFLNGGDESAREAYRQGYIDAMDDIRRLVGNCESMEDFIDTIQKILTKNYYLNPFKD